MRATTVNETSPIVIMMPYLFNTSVNEYDRTREPNGSSVIATLVLQGKTRDIFKWSQNLRSMKDVDQTATSLPKILERVYVSSSPSEVLNKIARIRTLVADWDRGFKAPSMKTITNALEIVAVFPKKFPVAKIRLSSDGEISFELIKGKKRAVIDIDEDHEFAYAYFQGNKFVAGKEKGVLTANQLPKDLVEYF